MRGTRPTRAPFPFRWRDSRFSHPLRSPLSPYFFFLFAASERLLSLASAFFFLSFFLPFFWTRRETRLRGSAIVRATRNAPLPAATLTILRVGAPDFLTSFERSSLKDLPSIGFFLPLLDSFAKVIYAGANIFENELTLGSRRELRRGLAFGRSETPLFQSISKARKVCPRSPVQPLSGRFGGTLSRDPTATATLGRTDAQSAYRRPIVGLSLFFPLCFLPGHACSKAPRAHVLPEVFPLYFSLRLYIPFVCSIMQLSR